MFKRIFLALLLVTSLQAVSAQSVYEELRNNAAKVVAAPESNSMSKQFAHFKLDALNYMAMKMKETMPDSTATFLDKQALAMNNFISYYLQSLVDNNAQPAAYQIKIIKVFMDASYSNPLFNDTDKELTLAYYADGNSITRFSLDTDWRRAVVAAMEGMKTLN